MDKASFSIAIGIIAKILPVTITTIELIIAISTIITIRWRVGLSDQGVGFAFGLGV